jgi:RNA polymerase sigma factor (sigma-70 family)
MEKQLSITNRILQDRFNPERNLSLYQVNQIEKMIVEKQDPEYTNKLSKEELELVLGKKKLIEQIFISCNDLLYSFSERYAKSGMVDDYYGEATYILMKCCNGYSDSNIKFTTYLCNSLKNEFYHFRNSNRIVKVTCNKLVVAYNKIHDKLSKAGEPSSFEDVCDFLELDEVSKDRLWKALNIKQRNEDENFSLNDVSDYRNHQTDECDKLLSIIAEVELTDFERDSFEVMKEVRDIFNSKFKNYKQVGEKYNYSKEASRLAAKRARIKIKRVLEFIEEV